MLGGNAVIGRRDITEDEAATKIQSAFKQKQLTRGKVRKANRGKPVDSKPTGEAKLSPSESGREAKPSADEADSLPPKSAAAEIEPEYDDDDDVIEDTVAFLREQKELHPNSFAGRLRNIRIEGYLIFEESSSSLSALVLSVFILISIIISVACFMLETVHSLAFLEDSFFVIDVICTTVFMIEYISRLFVCGVIGTSAFKFVKTPMNLVDLFAILPFFFDIMGNTFKDVQVFGVLRTVRLIRLFRIFKLGRYSSGLQLMYEALKNSSQALGVLSFFLGIGIILFSSAVYYAEKLGCPDREELAAIPVVGDLTRTELDRYVERCRTEIAIYPKGFAGDYLCCDEHDAPLDFPSIIEAFWWSIVTMTTVGYGEIYPKTTFGKIVGIVTMLSGILLIALPVAIIGRKFQEAYDAYLFSQNGKGAARERKCAESAQRSRMTENEGPSVADMGRRMRLMKIADAELSVVARELAENLDEVGVIQKEILSMETFELTKQTEMAQKFDRLLGKLECLLVEPEKGKNIRSTSRPVL